MGRGKYHHRRQDEDTALGGSAAIGMDSDGSYRTHMLFPGRRDDEEGGFRGKGSPFLKNILSLGRKESSRGPRMAEQAEQQSDPFFKNKQVSFVDGLDGRMFFERPERRPNSYNCDPRPGQRQRTIPPAFTEHFSPGGSGQSKSGGGGAVKELLAAVGGQAAAPATGGQLTRTAACDPFAVNGNGPPRASRRSSKARNGRKTGMIMPKDLNDVTKDCFIIPQNNLERFLPDGIAVRKPVYFQMSVFFPQLQKSHSVSPGPLKAGSGIMALHGCM